MNDKYFQNPQDPTKVLCIVNCSDKESHLMEFVGWVEIFPTFLTSVEKVTEVEPTNIK